MEDVTRKRVLRKLESLPEEQLYQVLDYIEFLEAKYASAAARKPDPFQQFAERVEDQMRVRSLAPKAMRGTMKLMSTAGRVLDGVRELGRDIAGAGADPSGPTGGAARGPAARTRSGPSPSPASPASPASGENGHGGRAGTGEGGRDQGRDPDGGSGT